MIRVTRSNRMEALAVSLAEVLDRPGLDAFQADHVVVPSEGMTQWLRLALAEQRGVVAHTKWWKPRALVEAFLEHAGAPVGAAWARGPLAWALLRHLDGLHEEPGFEELAPWLAQGPSLSARMQLAKRIAHVFDQYAVFRADWVQAWSSGQEDHWQARLWRRLEADLGAHHVAAAATRASAAWAELREPPEGLPRRVVIVAPTTLPPLFLSVLAAASAQVELDLLMLAPSEVYWGDAPTRRERKRLRRGRSGSEAAIEAALHAERAPALLDALGMVGRDFQDLVESSFDYQEGAELFVPSGAKHALATLQDDVLTYHRRAPEDRVALVEGDHSVRVLGAHSPIREVEILRDELLGLLRADPTLRPRDIFVLMPDVTVHGPLIDAVFGVDPSDPAWLPYAVADRPVAQGNDAARALLLLLGLVEGRLGAPALLEILSLGLVRERFGLGPDEVARMEGVVREVGIRWGRDGHHRATEGQPEVESFTWRFGLDRLVLGHAMASEVPVGGRVPYAHVEGDGAVAIGRFVDFAERVLDWEASLRPERTMEAWGASLRAALSDLLPSTPEADAARLEVDQVLASLALEAAEASWEAPVPLALVREAVTATLETQRRGGSFLRSGITFCEMLPMRSVPARVVALIGLSDGAFPRSDVHVGFDRMRTQRRKGDRSLRDDDRYLVLEALLSARDAVRLSYVSRSVKDNAPLPPSVVLADVLDALDATFVQADGQGAARDVLRVEHPLQPFSPRYVSGPEGLQTFDPAHDRAARSLLAPPVQHEPFLTGSLPPQQAVEEVDLEQLVRFFADPVLWFLQQRLGVGDAVSSEPVPEREPLVVEGLERWALGKRLLELRIAKVSWPQCEEVVRGEGLVPIGQLAAPVLGEVSAAVLQLLRDAGSRLAEPVGDPVSVELDCGGVRLAGRLGDLRATTRVEVLPKVLHNKGSHAVGPWIRHLALCTTPVARPSEVFGFRAEDHEVPGPVLYFAPLDAQVAAAALTDLVSLYRAGHERPLPFLPDASYQFACLKPGDAYRAKKEAESYWRLRDASRLAWERLVGGVEALQAPGEEGAEDGLSFASVARRVFVPEGVA